MLPSDYTRSRSRTDTTTLTKMFPELRARAFAVQGIEDFNKLKRVQESVAKLTEGGDWKEMRNEIAAELGDVDSAATRKHAETVLQTNGFQAYAAARYRGQQSRKDIFPYWKYVTMDDGRVRDRHAELDGVILPADDPFWKDHYPPWDFNCRCIVIEQTEEDALEAVAEGEGSMWDKATSEDWQARHRGMDATRQYHFRPDSLDMDLRDLAQAESRTPEDMEAFGKLMETRKIGTGEIAADGTEQTTNVREWLWKPIRAEYHQKVAADPEREHAFVVNAWTGAEMGHTVGTAHTVSIAEIPNDGIDKIVFHNHNSGNPLPSPRDAITAMRSDIQRIEAVSPRGWMRLQATARSATMRKNLEEWQRRLEAARQLDPARRQAVIAEWRKWLESQRRYGYLDLDDGGPLT